MGMNAQREAFGKKVADHMKAGAGDHNMNEGSKGGEHSSPVIGESKIAHHEDGSHTVTHHDGETTHHPSGGHMGVHMAAKHDGGEHGHIMPHGGGATTHHSDIGGEVHGPDEHGSFEEAANHLNGAIGDGAEPDGDEAGNMAGEEGDGASSFS